MCVYTCIYKLLEKPPKCPEKGDWNVIYEFWWSLNRIQYIITLSDEVVLMKKSKTFNSHFLLYNQVKQMFYYDITNIIIM